MATPDDYKPHQIARYGWKPDLPDHRDFYYCVSQPVPTPAFVDLRSSCPDLIYRQGALGSCTANALAAMYQYHQIFQNKPPADRYMPSRLFIYWNERYLENTVNEDSGASLRDGIRSLAKWGVADENLWPYHIENFKVKPSQNVYDAAKTGIITQYSRVVQKLQDLRVCLANKDPFVLGMMVYQSFESRSVARTGVVNMPNLKEQAIGGHAVLCVGYDDSKQRFLCRNSWGDTWGDKGYFTLPYEYMLNPDLTGDIWAIQMIP